MRDSGRHPRVKQWARWKDLLVEKSHSGTLGQMGEVHISMESWVRLISGVVGILEARFAWRLFGGGVRVARFFLCAKPLIAASSCAQSL